MIFRNSRATTGRRWFSAAANDCLDQPTRSNPFLDVSDAVQK